MRMLTKPNVETVFRGMIALMMVFIVSLLVYEQVRDNRAPYEVLSTVAETTDLNAGQPLVVQSEIRIARLCHADAERYIARADGTLVVKSTSPSASKLCPLTSASQ